MKRIIPYILFLIIPAGLLANHHDLSPKEKADTSSNNKISAKSIILRGNLSAFNAAYGKNFFELNWNTVAGDFDHFEIERSLDGEHYETLGQITGTEVSTEGQYSFKDHFKSAIARNNDFFYRLKQFEANGNFIYSKVLVARMYNNRTLASLSVTPDPLANDILVNVQLHENSYVLMKVSDENGNLLLREGQKAINGANTYTLSGTHNLRPGMYTLEITVNSKEKMTMRLAKG